MITMVAYSNYKPTYIYICVATVDHVPIILHYLYGKQGSSVKTQGSPVKHKVPQ